MARDVHVEMGGRVRTVQNWIDGNDYNPCGAALVPPPPEDVPGQLADLRDFCNGIGTGPLCLGSMLVSPCGTLRRSGLWLAIDPDVSESTSSSLPRFRPLSLE